MVSTLRSAPPASFKQRSKTVRSSRTQSQVHYRWVNLVLGCSPEDSRPEAIEEATKWLDGVAGELGEDFPAENA